MQLPDPTKPITKTEVLWFIILFLVSSSFIIFGSANYKDEAATRFITTYFPVLAVVGIFMALAVSANFGKREIPARILSLGNPNETLYHIPKPLFAGLVGIAAAFFLTGSLFSWFQQPYSIAPESAVLASLGSGVFEEMIFAGIFLPTFAAIFLLLGLLGGVAALSFALFFVIPQTFYLAMFVGILFLMFLFKASTYRFGLKEAIAGAIAANAIFFASLHGAMSNWNVQYMIGAGVFRMMNDVTALVLGLGASIALHVTNNSINFYKCMEGGVINIGGACNASLPPEAFYAPIAWLAFLFIYNFVNRKRLL